mgnify:CR=1 FL=1
MALSDKEITAILESCLGFTALHKAAMREVSEIDVKNNQLRSLVQAQIEVWNMAEFYIPRLVGEIERLRELAYPKGCSTLRSVHDDPIDA